MVQSQARATSELSLRILFCKAEGIAERGGSYKHSVRQDEIVLGVQQVLHTYQLGVSKTTWYIREGAVVILVISKPCGTSPQMFSCIRSHGIQFFHCVEKNMKAQACAWPRSQSPRLWPRHQSHSQQAPGRCEWRGGLQRASAVQLEAPCGQRVS